MQVCKYMLGGTGFTLIFLAGCAERLLLIAVLGGAGVALLLAALVIKELQVRREMKKRRSGLDAFYTGRAGGHPAGRRRA